LLGKHLPILSLSTKLAVEPQNWLTKGMKDEFDSFISIGNKEAKSNKNQDVEVIFKTFSNGVKTNRDTWAYNFDKNELAKNIKTTIEFYNEQLYKWSKTDRKGNIDEFLTYDDSKISWSRDLKLDLIRNHSLDFDIDKLRESLYRPFQKSFLYFDKILNEEVYVIPQFFPNIESEKENLAICTVTEAQIPFSAQIASCIPCLHYGGRQTQCFPFYIYNEDGSNRRENITDWALEQFQTNYNDKEISKWDIFYYTYAVLHHPEYREKYAANLKRELPRIPFVPEFRQFAIAGKRLAELHINYETQAEYPLEMIENKEATLDWTVEKMRYNKDKTSIFYNDFLTLGNIPPEAHEYRLGNRSALDWIVDQYQISTDKRSGIINNPNRADDKQYIVKLIKKIVTVSLKTVEIEKGLQSL
jgi:predicted helicase